MVPWSMDALRSMTGANPIGLLHVVDIRQQEQHVSALVNVIVTASQLFNGALFGVPFTLAVSVPQAAGPPPLALALTVPLPTTTMLLPDTLRQHPVVDIVTETVAHGMEQPFVSAHTNSSSSSASKLKLGMGILSSPSARFNPAQNGDEVLQVQPLLGLPS